MSGRANLFVPYLLEGEFRAPSRDSLVEMPLSEGRVSILTRVRAGNELAWAESMSRETSGFAMSLGETITVFYAGYRCGASPQLDWNTCFSLSTGLQNVPNLPELTGELGAPPVHQALSRPWSRAAFLTLPDGATGNYGIKTITPLAGLPLQIIDRNGTCDPTELARQAKQFDSYGAALEVVDNTRSWRWWWLEPTGEVTSGEAPSGAEVLQTWFDLAKLAGEGAGCVRLPDHVMKDRA